MSKYFAQLLNFVNWGTFKLKLPIEIANTVKLLLKLKKSDYNILKVKTRSLPVSNFPNITEHQEA